MKILLLGRNGQVGQALEKILAPRGELLALTRQQLDLADSNAIRAIIQKFRPEVIVNAAAYTAVDKAESEPELALAINGTAPGIMAEEAARLNALLVHYSTDYVFDGTKSAPYTELDIPHPQNIYGHSKLAGEQQICTRASRYLIFRTSWVYDQQGKNFLTTIKRLGGQRHELTIVNDQLGAPTWSGEIARTTSNAIEKYLTHTSSQQINGIYHLTAQGQTSWFDFARAAEKYGLFSSLAHPPTLRAISSAEFATTAKRPMYSVLSNAKLLAQFGLQLPDWEISLRKCLESTESEIKIKDISKNSKS